MSKARRPPPARRPPERHGILARHPSPVSLVPAGARRERHGYELLSTPVALREADPASIRPFPRPDTPHATYHGDLSVHGGSTWSRLADPYVPRGGEAPRPFARDDFLAFVEAGAHPDPATEAALRRALAFTPLSPGGFSTGTAVVESPPAHAPLDPLGARRIAHEERARTAATLHAWLDANVLLSGRGVLVRSPLFVSMRDLGGRTEMHLGTDFPVSPYSHVPVRPDLADAMFRAHGRPALPPDPSVPALFARACAGLSGDDDVVRLANRLPSLVDAAAGQAERRSPTRARRSVHDPETAAHMRSRLAAWARRGAIGGIGLEEAGDVLTLCVAAYRDLAASGVPMHGSLSGRFAEVEGLFIPRACAAPDEDIAAVAAMDPSP